MSHQPKTHCKRGHPFAGANVLTYKSTKLGTVRTCRECECARRKAYRDRDREIEMLAIKQARRTP